MVSLYLGAAYNALADYRERSTNLEAAAKHSEEALRMIPKEQMPSTYAWVQYNLGHAFDCLGDLRSSAAAYQDAIRAYEGALQVYNLRDYPVEYSHSLNSLANIYIDLARVNNEEANLNRAMEICKDV